jgi:hypothetical protein
LDLAIPGSRAFSSFEWLHVNGQKCMERDTSPSLRRARKLTIESADLSDHAPWRALSFFIMCDLSVCWNLRRIGCHQLEFLRIKVMGRGQKVLLAQNCWTWFSFFRPPLVAGILATSMCSLQQRTALLSGGRPPTQPSPCAWAWASPHCHTKTFN